MVVQGLKLLEMSHSSCREEAAIPFWSDPITDGQTFRMTSEIGVIWSGTRRLRRIFMISRKEKRANPLLKVDLERIEMRGLPLLRPKGSLIKISKFFHEHDWIGKEEYAFVGSENVQSKE